MFYVYVLNSHKNNDIYIDFSGDLRRRYQDHNKGNVAATRPNRPWKLVYYEAYLNKRDATKREKQLKNHAAKKDLKKQIEDSLEQS